MRIVLSISWEATAQEGETEVDEKQIAEVISERADEMVQSLRRDCKAAGITVHVSKD